MKHIFKDDIFKKSVLLITGGGSGIGKGITEIFCNCGGSVAIFSRNKERLEETADTLGKRTGCEILPLAGDVRKPDDIKSAVDKILNKWGRIDFLVNAAAGNFLAPSHKMSSNAFRTVIEIDLIGSFNCSQAVYPTMANQKSGKIINITATLGYKGTPMQAHAAAAKSGIEAMTRSLALEWGGRGINVNNIAPGPIEGTEGVTRLIDSIGIRGEIIKSTPLGRFGTISDIAQMTAYLASPAGDNITGATFVVDGGTWLTDAVLSVLEHKESKLK